MKSEKRIFISFILNFIFTIFEFVGGIITNSVALISDSIHDLGDSISMGIAIFLEKKSKQKPDYNYTYGYYRFSLLGALISSIILLIGSTIVVIEAVKRLINPELINAELVIYFAVFGVVVNGLAALNISKGKTLNEKVISLHLLEDVLGWVALLITAIIMHFTDILILDSILSIVFTLYIVYHVIKNLKQVLGVFLEKAPKGIKISNIIEKLNKVQNIKEIHHVHLWTLEGRIPLITLHAILDDTITIEEVTNTQKILIEKLKEFGIKHSTIQIEFEDNLCKEIDCSEEIPPNTGHKH
ncbi:cation diffusion facilitator family transporter [Mycoplasmatota bacterium WC30]